MPTSASQSSKSFFLDACLRCLQELRALVCPASGSSKDPVSNFSNLLKKHNAKLVSNAFETKTLRLENDCSLNKLPNSEFIVDPDSEHQLSKLLRALIPESESNAFEGINALSTSETESLPSSISLATDDMPRSRNFDESNVKRNMLEPCQSTQLESMGQIPYCVHSYDEDQPSVRATVVFPSDPKIVYSAR